ncbi:MAG TPA: hypothetical protein VFE24_02725, partial [Pirellulales bacterium]|nr:hypothetical protein [Pirellulales bacterium]
MPLAPGRVQAADPKEAAQQIAQLQTAGRQAYKDHNYQAAADRYRELIQRFPDAAEVPAARLNVARMLLEGPQKNPDAAIEALKPILDQQEFPQRAELLYEAGLAHRELGERLFTKAQHDSAADAPKTRAAAKEQFELAATHFSGAANAFASRGGPIKVSETESISVDFEWALRAKCDQAEMLNRAEDFSATLAAIERFLDHPLLAKSHYQHLALYQHGQAAFALKDYPTACRDLGKLAPFADRGIGLHTQYLLARMHQEMDELPEAARHYEAILTGYEAEKKMAQDALRDGNAFRDNPDERLRLEAIQRDPPPEFVRRCELQLGEIALADHRYADAAGRFQNFLKTNPPGELLAQTQLQLAMAQTGAKQFADALRLLQPLRDREPLAEAARTWSARAFVGGADPTKGPAYDQELNKAAEDFRHAIELAGKAKDPAA